MTAADIAQLRLYNQHLSHYQFDNAGAMLAHVGALQAQDFLASKWSVGVRLPNSTDEGVERAIADKSIVRTWTQRGTLHFVAPENVRWMLDIVGPRLLSGMKGRHKQLKLTDVDFAEAIKIVKKALKGGKIVTRDELKALLQIKGLGKETLQYNHILVHAALSKIICVGPRKGNAVTFVLLDEWVPQTKPIKREEALAKYAQLYFQSHAPATVADFAWWAGITLADAKLGFEAIKDNYVSEEVEGQTYFFSPSLRERGPGGEASILLLPSFDEYLIAYKDRGAVLNPKYNHQVMGTGNGLFAPIIVVDGIVQGTWKRTLKKDTVTIEILPFTKFNAAITKAIAKEAKRYAGFLEMRLVVFDNLF